MREVCCPSCGHRFVPGRDPEWAARMRRVRQERGIALQDLAAHLGWTSAYVSDIELARRNKPRPEVVERWEAFLGIGTAS